MAGAWAIETVVAPGPNVQRAATPAIDDVTAARQSAFDRRVDQAGSALAESLAKRGTQVADVSDTVLAPRAAAGLRWTREEIDVTVPGDAELLAAELGVRLARVPAASYSLAPHAESADEMVLTIRVEEHETHRVLVRSIIPRGTPRLAIIIESVGYQREAAKALMELEAALTFSVLPNGPYSRELAEQAHLAGREVMLHLPLEAAPPSDEDDANMLRVTFPETLLRTESPEAQLRAQVRQALLNVPHASGANNYLGGQFSTSEPAMTVVLDELGQRGLFFVDSMTAAGTVGARVARDLGLPSAERSVVLDEEGSYEATVAALEAAAQVAVDRGTSVAIGHPTKTTLEALRDSLPRLAERGIEIVPVSAVVAEPLVLDKTAASPGP